MDNKKGNKKPMSMMMGGKCMPRGDMMARMQMRMGERASISDDELSMYGTDELKMLFGEWLSALREEVKELQQKDIWEVKAVANELGISQESAAIILANESKKKDK